MIYTITAYRWGCLNGHQYAVAALTEPVRACELAQASCDDRGGKYGVAVYEWASEGQSTLIAYFPSMQEEKAPFHNERHDLFEGIGHDIHALVTTGVEWLPSPEEPSRLVPGLASDPPSWVRASVRRHEIDCRFAFSLRQDLAGAPQEPVARSAWIEAQHDAAEQATDALLTQGPLAARGRYLSGEAVRQEAPQLQTFVAGLRDRIQSLVGHVEVDLNAALSADDE
jgi:hypothetical protein